jgi:hypothetical protein
VYHCFNKAALPNDGQTPTNGQLFFVDTEEALDERGKMFPEISKNIMLEIETFLRANNKYVQSYQMMKEQIDIQKLNAEQNSE